jgi:hypothetical protein
MVYYQAFAFPQQAKPAIAEPPPLRRQSAQTHP